MTEFLRKNGLFVVGLGLVLIAAVMMGRGNAGAWLWVILGAAIIAFGAAQRQKAGKDRSDAR